MSACWRIPKAPPTHSKRQPLAAGQRTPPSQSLVWSLMFIIQPLGCVYYPVAALPGWLQPVCRALPPTYVFEGLRGAVLDHVLRADLMLTGLTINSLLFFAGAAFGFARLLAGARRAGTLLQTGE